jgi:hypothetical protein
LYKKKEESENASLSPPKVSLNFVELAQ